MALTVTNTNSLSLLNILNRTSNAQSETLQRLSTGSKINKGSDNPAGLIASRALQTELTAAEGAIANNQRTDSMLSVADKALNEVSSLITEIKSLATQSANKDGISNDELAANQSQIDSALSAIDRIVGSTQFNGKKLLDGSLGINVSGVDGTKISDLKVFSRDPNASTALDVAVGTAATKATLSLATTSASSNTSISIQGKTGTAVIDIQAGENLSSVLAKINAATAQTGVAASANASATSLSLKSSDYGSAAFVRVSVLSGDSTNIHAGNDSGSDAAVTVNGQTASVDGLNVNYTANGVSVSFNLTSGYNDGTVTGNESFTVENSGGATFQLGTSANTRSSIGLDGMFTQQLGSSTDGYLSSLRGGGANSLLNDPTQAAKIASQAADQIAKVQGRLGGFQKFQVKTAMNQQVATKESLTSALSTIQDVDYASETAQLNKQNVLLQSAISLLGLANQQSSSILSLLR